MCDSRPDEAGDHEGQEDIADGGEREGRQYRPGPVVRQQHQLQAQETSKMAPFLIPAPFFLFFLLFLRSSIYRRGSVCDRF